MPAHTARVDPSLLIAHNHTAESAPTSPLPVQMSPAVSTRRPLVTDRMVETVMTLTIVALEEEGVPAHGAGPTLYVYARDSEIAHNVRRTLEIFDGDMNEAIESIRTFVMDGVL